jgi:hypothetical protein
MVPDIKRNVGSEWKPNLIVAAAVAAATLADAVVLIESSIALGLASSMSSAHSPPAFYIHVAKWKEGNEIEKTDRSLGGGGFQFITRNNVNEEIKLIIFANGHSNIIPLQDTKSDNYSRHTLKGLLVPTCSVLLLLSSV